MKNLNKIFTHEDTKALYRKEKIKYFKVFKAVMICIGLVGIFYIIMAFYCLNDWNNEQLLSITN